MRRVCITTTVIVFWLVMTGWLIVCEIAPGVFAHASLGYKSLLSGGLLIADSWMKISLRGKRIGYSHTRIKADETKTVSQYQIDNETVLDLTVMGERQKVKVTAHAVLDAMYHLQDFDFGMKSRNYTMSVSGEREAGETFEVIVLPGGAPYRVRIDIPDNAVIYSPMIELALKQLKPGQQTRLKTFNPVSLTVSDIVVKALRKETVQHMGAAVQATLLAADCQGMEVLTWIDAEGRILRQETPFGWRLEKCSPEDALASGEDSQEAQDILLALAVPVSGAITAPHRRSSLRVRLRGVKMRREDLVSHRQEVGDISRDSVEMTLRADILPEVGAPLGQIPGGLDAFLASSPYIQAEDPDIVRRASEIVGHETDSLQAALLLYEWVFRNVRKEPTISVPSAAEVLRVMSGDCNEHTYLFVALARAAGIPARITVGLTYDDNAFYYHAWPAVYVGRWLEMDPTLGQPAVDATHVRLLEGELRDQMKLMGMIGRLRVEVEPVGKAWLTTGSPSIGQ